MTDTTNNMSSNVFQDQKSAADARLQINGWIKVGTALSDASKVLGEKGFSCSTADHTSDSSLTSILCIYSAPQPKPASERLVPPAAPVTWKVILDSDNGVTLTGIRLEREPKDLEG